MQGVKSGNGAMKAAALIMGLLSGPILFWVIEPILSGERPSPLFDHGAAIYFFFRLFPGLVLPGVCLIVAALGPKSKANAFHLGAIFALAALLPLPLVDYWRTTPALYGYTAFSRGILGDVATLGGYLIMSALIGATIASIVSLPINHFFSRLARSRRNG